MLKVLFLCTGNSCRSQMAEGWARQLKAGVIEAYSAGIEKHGMNPHAVRVMAEAGVDLAGQFSKTLDELKGVAFDAVVTVCGHADEHCPVFPGRTRIVHVGFADPPKLTKHLPDGEEKLAVFRRVRDEIRRFVETLPGALAVVKPEATVKQLAVYDPAMCCSTGICGPNVDPKLVQFAADLKWLQQHGIIVRRFNLSQDPAAFVATALVRQALGERGDRALPMIIADGTELASGRYPNRAELAKALDLPEPAKDPGRPASTPIPLKCCG